MLASARRNWLPSLASLLVSKSSSQGPFILPGLKKFRCDRDLAEEWA